MAHLQTSDWELVTSGALLVHVSTSFFESKRELHSSYRCPIYSPAFAFCAAESDQASKDDHPGTQCWRWRNWTEIQMFPAKNDLHFFLPKGTSHGCCCFPRRTCSRRNAGGHYLAQAPLAQCCGTSSVIPFHFSSKVSTAPAGSQGLKGHCSTTLIKDLNLWFLGAWTLLNMLRAPHPYPVYTHRGVHTGPWGQNTRILILPASAV